MEAGTGLSGIQVVDKCLIVTLKDDIDESDILRTQNIILETLKSKGAVDVIIDLTSVRIIDSLIFQSLKNTADMINIIGSNVVMVGIQPGVASSLVELDVDINSFPTCFTMDDGLELLRSRHKNRK